MRTDIEAAVYRLTDTEVAQLLKAQQDGYLVLPASDDLLKINAVWRLGERHPVVLVRPPVSLEQVLVEMTVGTSLPGAVFRLVDTVAKAMRESAMVVMLVRRTMPGGGAVLTGFVPRDQVEAVARELGRITFRRGARAETEKETGQIRKRCRTRRAGW